MIQKFLYCKTAFQHVLVDATPIIREVQLHETKHPECKLSYHAEDRQLTIAVFWFMELDFPDGGGIHRNM